MREWTNKVGEAMDDGMLDAKAVAEMCLSFMSEDDVKEMCQANDLTEYLSPVSSEPTELQEAYEDGECPDCGRSIPDDAEEGDSCECGHVFWLERDDDPDVSEAQEWADYDPDC